MRANPKAKKRTDRLNGHGFLNTATVIVLLSLALSGTIYSINSYFQIQSLNSEINSLRSSSVPREVLIFGDSITSGKPTRDGGWVGLLHQHFDLLRITKSATVNEPLVINMGVSGNTSDDILKRIVPETIEKTYNNRLPIVLIQIGTNDSVRLPIKTYEDNLKKIIKKLKPISSKIIFVGLPACDKGCSSLYYSGKHRTNESLKKYENKMKTVAAEEKVEFIPVFDDFKKELDKGKKLLADGLHPNKDGYNLMYEIISEKLIQQLTE
jgi:lysophospholipase L1-like esterase